jgi:hypothetical protein
MGDQGAEIEGHVDPGVGAAEWLTVQVHLERAVQFPVLPALAELVGGDQHRRQRRGRFGLEKAEAFGELGRNEVAQADVIDEPDQTDVPRACSGETPRGTSSVTTITSASRSQPQLSSASGIGSRGASISSDAP